MRLLYKCKDCSLGEKTGEGRVQVSLKSGREIGTNEVEGPVGL